jgi:hypothetical protein
MRILHTPLSKIKKKKQFPQTKHLETADIDIWRSGEGA